MLNYSPDRFNTDGYCIFRNVIPSQLLQVVQKISTEWIANALSAFENNAMRQQDAVFVNDGSPYVLNIGRLFELDFHRMLELLRHIQPIADSICTVPTVMAYDVMVVKTFGDAAEVPWHQDILSTSTTPLIQCGIYLDAADDRSGALQVIPGTHLKKQNICELAEAVTNNDSKVLTLEAAAGDVVIHHSMLVHSSLRMQESESRRIIYFDLRDVRQMIDEERWDSDWIEERLQLANLVRSNGTYDPTTSPNIYHKTMKARGGNFCLPSY